MKKNIIFFAEIGKTNLSSNASEELLKKLVKRLNLNQKGDVAKIFFYPIFSPFNLLNWLFYFPKENKNNLNYFFSTSIKLLRDFIYIFSSVITIIYLKPKFSFFYNLNKLQIRILYFLKIFFKLNLNLIQADGYLFNSKVLNIFDNVIVFSNFAYQKYKNFFSICNLFFSYPSLSEMNTNNSKPNIERGNYRILHAGSISSYNACRESIMKLFEFCESHKSSKVYFTLNQRKVPDYFKDLLKLAPSNFIFKGFITNAQLKSLLKKINIGLDLRNYHKEKNKFNKCDFPSKVIFYLRNNLFILSTKSESIPRDLRDWLIPIEDLHNLEKINFAEKEMQIKKIINQVNSYSLDIVLNKNFILK